MWVELLTDRITNKLEKSNLIRTHMRRAEPWTCPFKDGKIKCCHDTILMGIKINTSVAFSNVKLSTTLILMCWRKLTENIKCLRNQAPLWGVAHRKQRRAENRLGKGSWSPAHPYPYSNLLTCASIISCAPLLSRPFSIVLVSLFVIIWQNKNNFDDFSKKCYVLA